MADRNYRVNCPNRASEFRLYEQKVGGEMIYVLPHFIHTPVDKVLQSRYPQVIHTLSTRYPQVIHISTGYPQAPVDKVIHRLSTGAVDSPVLSTGWG